MLVFIVFPAKFSINRRFISLALNVLGTSSKQISFRCCVYISMSAANGLPILSIADVKMQKTQRTDDSDSCHNPHDYYKR